MAAACDVATENTGAGRGCLLLPARACGSRGCLAKWIDGSRTREPWLSIEHLAEKPMSAQEIQSLALSGWRWLPKKGGGDSMAPGTCDELVESTDYLQSLVF